MTDVSPPWIKRTTFDASSDIDFKWNIAPVAGVDSQFTITPAKDPSASIVSFGVGDSYWKYGYPIGKQGGAAKWVIQKDKDSYFSKIYRDGYRYPVDSYEGDANSSQAVHFYADKDTKNQKWVFELVIPPPPPNPTGKSFKDLFFSLTAGEAAKLEYDIIVVGTGIGGGVVAGDLFDSNSKLGGGAKSVLVIEKGGLTFHSHCLNASRPTGFGEDRAQQNDTFFALFKDQYKGTEGNQDWKGGPMHNLGGRSAAWGLFVPRIHDEVLEKNFAQGTGLAGDLIKKWYPQAESLMNLSLPATTTTHQSLMERLNMTTKRDCQWQWGRIASEFHDTNMKNFDFALGAYSTIDKLLEIAMSKDRKDRTSIEHKNWKILLDTEVREIIWNSDGKQATGVRVKTSGGLEYTIKLKPRVNTVDLLPAIILSAGSVASPSILMRSGLSGFLKANGGLRITDHDIFAKAFTFNYLRPSDRDRVGSMKLQSYVRPTPGSPIALANIAIDASSFLPREVMNNRVNASFPILTAAFIRSKALSATNTITLQNDEPVVTITREPRTPEDKNDMNQLKELVLQAKDIIQDVLQITYPSDKEGKNVDEDKEAEDFFRYLELGGVAHELGTIPMVGAPNSLHCVDRNLKLRQKEGVFVCDLSVFPFSPEVNPTLTLAALALRLSRTILPRLPISIKSILNDTVYVMNQTGDKISALVSNVSGSSSTSVDKRETLEPGAIITRKRTAGTKEVAFVFRLKYNSTVDFVSDPVLFVASPGAVLAIE